MHGLGPDLRNAWRSLRRAPGFTAVAILCLAVAIGINATAFSMLDALLFRSLPGVVRQQDIRAVVISRETRWGRSSPALFSALDWEIYRGAIPAFTSSGAMGMATVALPIGGEPIAARADFVSGGFFALLGTAPALGRLLTDADDRAGAPPAAVIAHAFWLGEFDGRPDIVGMPLEVGGETFTIVGVAPRGFVGLHPGELGTDPRLNAPFVFLPLATAPLARPAGHRRREARGSLAPDGRAPGRGGDLCPGRNPGEGGRGAARRGLSGGTQGRLRGVADDHHREHGGGHRGGRIRDGGAAPDPAGRLRQPRQSAARARDSARP